MNPSHATPAVRVSNGCKNYGKSVVFNGLEMTVKRGITYALLGSSGCGKTTLLSSIVGIKQLTSGSVQIFGKDASKNERTSIGFMPQESGVHAELTISEELHFFGRLYGMEWSYVEERIRFLVDLLQLPGENCLIQNLSGGQTRRVSLAVTLLHKPSLLILDEATVGVDPLLRQNIWEHLYELVKQDGTTIICSTHYTEEARQADIVSVMRNGKLLVEENPDKLMTTFGATLLEDVVLKLCHSQELEGCPINNDMNSWDNNNTPEVDGNIINISYKRRSSADHWVDAVSARKYSYSVNHKPTKRAKFLIRQLQTIYAMFILHFIKFKRSPLITILLLTIPASICIIAYAVYRPEPHPKIGVVNLEQPNCLNLPPDQHKLGCELVFFLIQDDKLELESFPTEESALSALHRGNNMAYFIIPGNLTRNTAQRFAFGRYADNMTLTGSNIPVYMDFSHYVNNIFLLDGLWSGYKAFTTGKLATSVNDSDGLHVIAGTSLSPFKFNTKLADLIPVQTAWYDEAATVPATSYIMITPATIALSIVWDKKRGVFMRTVIGGGSLLHLLISGVLAYSLIYFGQVAIVLGTIKCLQTPFLGSILDIVILTYGQHLIGLTFGVLVGLLLRQELEAIFFILAFFMLAVCSGSMAPWESLGYWVKWVVVSLPTKLASGAFQNILFRGWTILNPGMLSCFINQGAWIASALALSGLAYLRVYKE